MRICWLMARRTRVHHMAGNDHQRLMTYSFELQHLLAQEQIVCSGSLM